jgi:hypothetical protein
VGFQEHPHRGCALLCLYLMGLIWARSGLVGSRRLCNLEEQDVRGWEILTGVVVCAGDQGGGQMVGVVSNSSGGSRGRRRLIHVISREVVSTLSLFAF